jgi:hypothetical protein
VKGYLTHPALLRVTEEGSALRHVLLGAVIDYELGYHEEVGVYAKTIMYQGLLIARSVVIGEDGVLPLYIIQEVDNG